MIEIRPIASLELCNQLERLQRDVWEMSSNESVVPGELLFTVAKNGGIVLGAFDSDRPRAAGSQTGSTLIGFAFGFLGLTESGQPKHTSHMLGVLPGYRDQQVGLRLKRAQRDIALAQQVELMTWTFDPLEGRNAYLNLRKLGAVCSTFYPDLYGAMPGVNAGLPSDRFQVDWHLRSTHVTGRLDSGAALPTIAGLRAAGVPELNLSRPQPAARAPLPDAARLLVHIPAHFQTVKAADIELARAWRLHTRALFQSAFAAGYVAVDCLHEDGETCYLLEHGWTPS